MSPLSNNSVGQRERGGAGRLKGGACFSIASPLQKLRFTDQLNCRNLILNPPVLLQLPEPPMPPLSPLMVGGHRSALHPLPLYYRSSSSTTTATPCPRSLPAASPCRSPPTIRCRSTSPRSPWWRSIRWQHRCGGVLGDGTNMGVFGCGMSVRPRRAL